MDTEKSFLRPHWLAWVIVSAIIIGALENTVIWSFVNNGNVLTALIGFLVILFLIFGLGVVMIKRFVVTVWLMAALIVIPAGMLIMTLPHHAYDIFPTLKAVEASSTDTFSGEVKLSLVTTFYFGLAMIFEIILYRFTNRVSWKLSLLLAILLIPIYFVASRI